MKHTLRLTGRRVTTIYSDALNLQALGSPVVARASEVEYDNDLKGWTVKFADGMYLCLDGYSTWAAHAMRFATRAEALAAEVAELEARLRSKNPPRVVATEGKAAVVLFDPV